jgi:outer membrane protein OmpA-like peptidoglycan-associated protein
MRLKNLLLAGAALPAILIMQSAIARDGLLLNAAAPDVPTVLAQDNNRDQNQNQNDNRQRQQGQRQGQGQGQQQQQQRQQQQQQQDNQQKRQQEQRQRQQDNQQQRQQEQQQRQQQQQQRQQDQQKRQQDQQDRQQRQQQQRDDRRERQQDQREQKQDRQQQQREQRQDRQQEQREQRLDRQQQQRDQKQDPRQDSRQDSRQQRNDDGPRRLDDVRGERKERREGNRTVIQEGNRTIVREGDRTIIRRDEADRFRRVGRDVNVQRVGGETRTVVVGPNGQRIVTVTDANGRLLRRSRFVNNREVIIIDNRPRGGRRADAFFIALPALAIASLAIPRERYIVEAESAPPDYIYGALMAPPVEPLPRAYTLDEIRYSPDIRDRMPRIDLDTVTFDLGSWEVRPDQYDRLAPIAEGIRRAIAQNPNEVFLIEGHTDATGNDDDNLSLSDRRAEAVSVIMTDHFQIPPENLTTQGYGEQQLKVPTDGPERANRRVTVRRITPLLQQEQAAGSPAPR